MGRPPHLPGPVERRQVEAMAGYGVREDDIARVIGIDPKTLRKHYRAELDTGHIKANAKVAESLFRKATGDGRQSVTAAIFWLKTRAGWTERAVQSGHACSDDRDLVIRTRAEIEAEEARTNALVTGFLGQFGVGASSETAEDNTDGTTDGTTDAACEVTEALPDAGS